MRVLNSVDTSTLFDVIKHVRSLRLKPINPFAQQLEITNIPKSQVQPKGVKHLPAPNTINVNLASIDGRF